MKLPFTWPNSSDSSSVSGMPAQLTGTKAASARALAASMARATTSLPDAALAGDEHLGVRAGDPLDFGLQLRDHLARADQLDVAVLPHRLPQSTRPLHCTTQTLSAPSIARRATGRTLQRGESSRLSRCRDPGLADVPGFGRIAGLKG